MANQRDRIRKKHRAEKRKQREKTQPLTALPTASEHSKRPFLERHNVSQNVSALASVINAFAQLWSAIHKFLG